MVIPSEAHQNSATGNQKTEHLHFDAPSARIDLDKISWDDLKLFLILAANGSFRAAATATGKSVNTIRATLDRLENAVGEELGRRSINGLSLTPLGHELREVATHMRVAGIASARESARRGHHRERTVRIAVTEGLGTVWLVPRMVQFREKHRDVTVDITCDMRPGDVLQRETDIAVSLDRPTQPDLKVGKLGNLHLMLFASHDYLAERGHPKGLDDWKNHNFVEQVTPTVPHSMLDLFVSPERPANFTAFRVNTSSGHFWAIAQGAGIGLLPTYIRAISRKVRPLDLPVRLRREIWFAYHPEAQRSLDVRRAIAWLKASFNPAKYPWFSDEFVHPDDFPQRLGNTKIIQLFEGFVDTIDPSVKNTD